VGKKEEVHVCMEANTFGLSRDGEIPIEEEEGDGAGGGGGQVWGFGKAMASVSGPSHPFKILTSLIVHRPSHTQYATPPERCV
jgi:hypothetical protein